MVTVFVRSKCADYATWRRVYDSHAGFRRDSGIVSEAVCQLDGDPNDITVLVDFNSMEAAKAFATSDDLRQRMQEAGTVGAPDIWFTTRV